MSARLDPKDGHPYRQPLASRDGQPYEGWCPDCLSIRDLHENRGEDATPRPAARRLTFRRQ